MTTHRHTAAVSTDRAYEGTVNPERENRAAHGCITRHERCACGAERRININGQHTERGEWAAEREDR